MDHFPPAIRGYFVDVGANVGYYSLLASKLVGAHGAVVAIEASPSIFSQLQTNLELNQVSNVRSVNAAASDHEGEAKIFKGHQHNIGLTTVLSDTALEFECKVPAAPLAKILQPNEIERARIIKIDVEGAEASVVSGMRSIVMSGRNDLEIIVEVNPAALARQGITPESLLKPFLDIGYHPYEIENDYSALSYIPVPAAKRPRRIRSVVPQTMDIVLSRLDDEYL
jgi:FkbM family methyltransferase